MKVDFRHVGCTIEEHLKDLVEQRLGHLAQVLDEPTEAEARFAHESSKASSARYTCEVTIRSHGHVVRAHASGSEQLHAFDLVEAKLRHQLEKLKGRLLLRSHPHHRAPKVDGLAADDLEISRSKRFRVSELTPQEAAFQMEMLSHSFYLFQNAETGTASVIYRRADGTVGLIDSEA